MANQLKSNVVRDQILKWIEGGQLGPGHRLPSERDLARDLGMNHVTIRRGLAKLVSEGLIIKKPSVGNFVPDVRQATQLAIVLPQYVFALGMDHPYFSQVINGVHMAVDPQRYSVSLMPYTPGNLWMDAGRIAVDRQVRGVILAPGKDVDPRDVQKMMNANLQIVLIKQCKQLLPMGLYTIFLDNQVALSVILKRVIESGHRRVLIAHYTGGSMSSEERLYTEGLCRQYGLGDPSDVILDIPMRNQWIDFSVLEQIFSRKPMPTAVIIPDEFGAVELFRVCYQKHVRIPDDLSVAAVWDSMPQRYPIPLTAMDSARLGWRLGELAVEYVTKLISGERPVERIVSLYDEVQWKASLAPVPSTAAAMLG